MQRNLTPGGDKNGADINLALDALEMAFTHTHISGYVIVGGDSDFISLVEKLKQYDKQIFVVGGRSFTSQVMQRNCHEFIAYENLIGGRGRGDRGARGPAGPAASQAPVDQVMPLMRRALKMLTDREVTPQLGLLKSTLLQLDSTFSERTYGVSSFRDFAEKLATAGFRHAARVGPQHPGRAEGGRTPSAAPAGGASAADGPRRARAGARRTDEGPIEGAPAPLPAGEAPRMVEAIAEVRRLFQSAQNPPRWPMYVRQVKQFLRGVDPTFDERKFGFNSLNDLLRGCQKDGLFRMERDRQGVVRFFQGNVLKGPESARPGSIDAADIAAAERLAAQAEAEMAAQEAREREAEVVEGDVVRETQTTRGRRREEAPGCRRNPPSPRLRRAPRPAPAAGARRKAQPPRRRRQKTAKAPKAARERARRRSRGGAPSRARPRVARRRHVAADA